MLFAVRVVHISLGSLRQTRDRVDVICHPERTLEGLQRSTDKGRNSIVGTTDALLCTVKATLSKLAGVGSFQRM